LNPAFPSLLLPTPPRPCKHPPSPPWGTFGPLWRLQYCHTSTFRSVPFDRKGDLLFGPLSASLFLLFSTLRVVFSRTVAQTPPFLLTIDGTGFLALFFFRRRRLCKSHAYPSFPHDAFFPLVSDLAKSSFSRSPYNLKRPVRGAVSHLLMNRPTASVQIPTHHFPLPELPFPLAYGASPYHRAKGENSAPWSEEILFGDTESKATSHNATGF